MKIELVLEQIIATADQEIGSRKVKFLGYPSTGWVDNGYGRITFLKIRHCTKIGLSRICSFKQ